MDFSAHPNEEVALTVSGDQYTPVVAGLANGGYVVAWESAAGASPGVYAQVYDAQGHKSGGEITVFYAPNSPLASWTGYHVGGVAGLADGSFVVSAYTKYVDPSSGDASALYAQRIDASGNAAGSPVLVQQGTNDQWAQGGPVLPLAGGGYAVIEQRVEHPQPYSTVSEVVHRFDAGGTAAGTPVVFGQYSPANYDVAATQAGNFVMAGLGIGAGPTTLSWQVVDANGSVISSQQLASTYGSTQYAEPTVVSLANGKSLVVWELAQYDSSGAISARTWQAQSIGTDGKPGGGVFNLPLDVSAQTAVKLTALASGGFLATWPQAPFSDGGTVVIAGQAFDAFAHTTGEVLQLASVPGGDLYYHLPYAVAATRDAGFVLSTEAGSGSNGLDVYEQKFDLAPIGAPAGQMDVSGRTTATAVPSGSFTIRGDGGTEQVAFASAHTAWTITPTAQGVSLDGPEGTDLLVNVERVRFGDSYALAFDVTGHAGEAYRLYQAAFARAPDDAGLGFHIRDLDAGVPLWAVGQHFVDSPEFQTTYGSLDNTQFITLLYRNVLHRDPDSAGLQFHLNEFAQGETRADMLTHFSESPENQANVLGQISNGMWFVPLA